MCGISGIFATDGALYKALAITLSQMERGIQGTGIAVVHKGRHTVLKQAVTPPMFIVLNKEALDELNLGATLAISHNRQPSNGGVKQENTHPFTGCQNKFSLIHNGIATVEKKRKELLDKGHKITGETDSEILSHLLEDYLAETKDMGKAMRKLAENDLNGAILVLFEDAIYGVWANYPKFYTARYEDIIAVGSTEDALQVGLGIPKKKIHSIGEGQVLKIGKGRMDTFFKAIKSKVRYVWKGGYSDGGAHWYNWDDYGDDGLDYEGWYGHKDGSTIKGVKAEGESTGIATHVNTCTEPTSVNRKGLCLGCKKTCNKTHMISGITSCTDFKPMSLCPKGREIYVPNEFGCKGCDNFKVEIGNTGVCVSSDPKGAPTRVAKGLEIVRHLSAIGGTCDTCQIAKTGGDKVEWCQIHKEQGGTKCKYYMPIKGTCDTCSYVYCARRDEGSYRGGCDKHSPKNKPDKENTRQNMGRCANCSYLGTYLCNKCQSEE